jgi:hypothetical protein
MPNPQDVVFEVVTPPPRFRPMGSEAAGAGPFYTETTMLPAGLFQARFQVMLPEPPPIGAELVVSLREAEAPEPFARRRTRIDPWVVATGADWQMLEFSLAAPARVVLFGHISAGAAQTRMRAVKIQRIPALGAVMDWQGTHGSIETWPLTALRTVTIGNSGVCTASCLHCPTNKPWLPAPRGEPMQPAIFARIVEGLAACGLPIRGGITLGLYADPMTDRHLSARVRQLKETLPGVPVTISTTAAAFAARHEEAVALADGIGVHIESLVPETYDRLMAPLRFARVKPRIEALVRQAGRRAHLSLPLHRANRAEVPAMRAWWASLGGGTVMPQPFSNRLSSAPEVLGLHLAPVTGACTQDLAADLIIDWDGRLLACCNDFGKASDLGSVAERDLPALIADQRRARMFRLLKGRDWQAMGICRGCLFDDPVATRAAAEGEAYR